MAQRVYYDGLNLGLAQGTGIATYTRVLSHVARDLGYETGVVYSTPNNPAKNPLLREIAFFDERRPGGAPRQKTVLPPFVGDAKDQLRGGRPVRPTRVEFTGAVVARQFEDTLPAQDHVFVARKLFARARTYFGWRRSFVTLACDPAPDILHCTYQLPLRAKSACNVYTIHDLVPLRLPFTTLDNKREQYRLLRKIAREADHIITVSEHSKRDIVALLDVPESRVTNTYQTVDIPQKFTDLPETVVANRLDSLYGLAMHDYLLFFGALEPKKNVVRLVNAYLTSQVNIPLVLVTGGGWHNDAENKILVDRGNLLTERGKLAAEPRDASGRAPFKTRDRRRIHRLDYASFADLIDLVRGARAVLFPSLYEGFGLPVLEAMVLGTPVVTARESSLPEIAGDAALLVDPYSVDDIARAITTIAGDKDLGAELSRRGRVQAEKFSVQRYRERIGDLYGRLR